MQIHELNKKQPLNELDIAGPDGVISNTKAALGALKQPGGVKDALRTATPGQGQGLTSTAELVKSDFAKRMQAVKNSAAMKQVAANIQQQWEQIRKTLPAAQAAPAAATTTSAPGYSSVKTNAPAGIPTVGGTKLPQPTVATGPAKATPPKATPAGTPTTTGTYNKKTGAATMGGKSMVAAKDLPPHIQKQLAAVTETAKHTITEAASLPQVTDWFTKAVIPQSMAAHQAEYLKNPTIQSILKGIVAAENQPDDKRQQLQAAEFLNLVSAAGAVSQQIAATQPRTAATGTAAAGAQSSSVQSATSDLEKLAGLTATQISAIQKIFANASPVSTRDPNTANFLRALGLTIS